MKNFGLCFLLFLLGCYCTASPTTKELHKMKLKDKLRSVLNSSEEVVHQAPAIPTEEELHMEDSKTTAVGEEEEEEVAVSSSEVVQDEVGGDNSKVETEVGTVVQTTYMARFRNVLKRVMELLGFRRRKDGTRQSRLLSFVEEGGNGVEDRTPVYQEEVRTTVGAVLGHKECIQKVACVSGSYLNGVKGKQLIFAFLDVFSPTTWKETVKIAKQSAIFNESCDYRCLE